MNEDGSIQWDTDNEINCSRSGTMEYLEVEGYWIPRSQLFEERLSIDFESKDSFS